MKEERKWLAVSEKHLNLYIVGFNNWKLVNNQEKHWTEFIFVATLQIGGLMKQFRFNSRQTMFSSSDNRLFSSILEVLLRTCTTWMDPICLLNKA